MPEVPRAVRTVTDAQLRALVTRFAPDLDRQQRAHVLALIVHETGRRPVQYNLGNLATPRSRQSDPSVSFWRPPWFEVDENSSTRDLALHQLMLEGKEPSAFYAYPTLEAGARAYLELLRSARFEGMLAARTPLQFLNARKSSGYTPALDVAKNLPGFTSLTQRFGGSPGRGADVSEVNVGGVNVEATPAALALMGVAVYAFRAWQESSKKGAGGS